MLPKVTLNATDLHVSQLCYGTNMLGTAIDHERGKAVLDRFLELGGNFLDTARSYGDWIPDAPAGASERAIGAWLKGQQRADIVIATKGGFFDMRVGDYRNRCTPDDVNADLTQSLEHLGVDSIDLYFLHMDNEQVPVKELVDALLLHQTAGRIRHFAASNWAASRIAEANSYAASLGKQGFVASETFWGLAVPDAAAAAIQGYQHYYEGEYEALHAAGLPIIAYAAQSGGYFTKLAAGHVPEGLAARYANPVNHARFDAASTLARKYGVSINDVVIAYATSQPFQTLAVFGGSNPAQIEDSAKAAALKLSPDDLALLRSA